MSYGKDYARLVVMHSGDIQFFSSYDAGLVSALKDKIPWRDRRWDKEQKCWQIAPQHAQTLIDISSRYLGVDADVQGNLLTVSNDPVIEVLKLEYLGTAKERDSGERTAYGWVGGGWNAVFALKVLKSWFAFEDDKDDPTAAATLYAVLGIKKDAPGAELKKAWRRAARQWHPDVCREPNATEQFKRIQAAYETLRNPQMRRRYDAGLHFQKQVKPERSAKLNFLDNSSWWYPPLRCGWVTVQAVKSLGRYEVRSILSWDDIERGGKTMISHWPRGAEHFEVRFV